MAVFRVGSSRAISDEENKATQEFIKNKGVTKIGYMIAHDVPDLSMRNAVNKQYKHHNARKPKAKS